MASSFDEVLERYNFAFPPELIAQSPASPRDSARLLVVGRQDDRLHETTFRSLVSELPKNAVLVLNETKVIPARLPLKRSTGGIVMVLVLGKHKGHVRILGNRRLKVGEELHLTEKIKFKVVGDEGKEWILKPLFPLTHLSKVLERHGQTPLPPYIKHSPLTEAERRREYQTVFAKSAGSIAAPTASLHFTTRLLKQLEKQGITIVRVTLHVHLGTFAPLTEEQWKSGGLHHEEYVISKKTAATIHAAKKAGRPVIAVGTTVVRTLESAADRPKHLRKLSGETNLFIREGYDFKIVDGLITNFHVPRSSLMMLVGAFSGREKIIDAYRYAIEKKFRLFSFGDGMLIF